MRRKQATTACAWHSSKAVTDALQYVASHGMGSASAPVLVRLISALAGRFGIVVTQKAMAQTIPVIGALGGGLVNTVFISHFQDMARGHFAIRALERKYGVDVVEAAYLRLKIRRRTLAGRDPLSAAPPRRRS